MHKSFRNDFVTMPIDIIVNAGLLMNALMSTASPHVLGIDPMLYRHFAIGTIAIALIVAAFAGGETQNTMAQNRQNAELQNSTMDKLGKSKLVDNRSESVKNSAAGMGFDEQSESPTGMEGDGDSPMSASHGKALMKVIIEPNQAAMANMDSDRRESYIKGLQDEASRIAAKGHYIPSSAQIEAIAASSAARAGPPTTD